jgi:hypothetical protein
MQMDGRSLVDTRSNKQGRGDPSQARATALLQPTGGAAAAVCDSYRDRCGRCGYCGCCGCCGCRVRLLYVVVNSRPRLRLEVDRLLVCRQVGGLLLLLRLLHAALPLRAAAAHAHGRLRLHVDHGLLHAAGLLHALGGEDLVGWVGWVGRLVALVGCMESVARTFTTLHAPAPQTPLTPPT